MPINVDTVYQTVQALANKEQRGYITPQEFNLFANQVQSDIFEQYFYDLNAFRKASPMEREIGDSVNHVMRKIQATAGVTISRVPCVYNPVNFTWSSPPGPNTGKLFATTPSGEKKELEPIGISEINNLRGSRWHRLATDEYLYFEDGHNTIQVHTGLGPVITGVEVEAVTGMPGIVSWGYVIVNEEAVYNPATSNNFALHASERADVVVNILKLAGISIEDPQLYQAAASEEQQNLQQENK